VALFTDNAATGTYLWAETDTPGSANRILSLNEQLAGIATGSQRIISYRGADGDSLKGLVLLPPDYQASRLYPTIVWVYGGTLVRDSGGVFNKNLTHPFNMQPLAARGYVVLIPSIPLQPEGRKSDPYLDIPKGVLPAVDRLVQLSIADPNRLGVMGHSYGGYTTYALVSYTKQFRAAVAMAGLSDLISLYGQFDVRERYADEPQANLFFPALSERGIFRMGGSPWDDFWRYAKNSPLFYLDRVQTPVMIIQGDQDYDTMTQGEELFSGLYRLGKPVKFVRYWGEDHVLDSPANIRHMWAEIFDWFDRYLREK
jgi:dipeptidyl aminopeptidase/acylaminoacyl peptidase